MNQFIAQLTQFVMQFTPKQRIIVTGIALLFLSSVVALVMWANRTEYDLLYANMDPQDASEVVTALSNDKIKYRLENGGTTIYVQQDMVDELRIRFHAYGGGAGQPQGWDDIFDPDKNNLGETTTMTRIKILRALEGELERTINMMTWVKNSRVHLNIPDRRLFEEDRKGSASVTLTLTRGGVSDKQLQSIPQLVAHSVENISPEDVTVVDSHGNLLYNGEAENNLGQSGTQWELTKNVESQLQRKVRSILEASVGVGNVKVQVGAELNFDQVQKTIQDIDPDDVTVVSEEIINEATHDNTDSSLATAENSTTNYEFSKVVQNIVTGTGNIKRLTVSVLVNGEYVSVNGNDEQKEYQPRSQEDLDKLTALVKNAIGYNEQRGDQVTVVNMRFVDPPVYDDGWLDIFKSPELWKQLLTYILVGAGLFMAFNLIKGMMNSEATSKILLPIEIQQKALMEKRKTEKALQGMSDEDDELDENNYISKLSPEARARMRAKDKMTVEVVEFANDHPDQATSLMRAWLTAKG
ncbi:MAG: flagellar M-ring protein FliF [Calditrichaeota bacterium]|nr:MAG: flagellar M-ring protein FliF [Calditrichota bacterium]